MKKQQLPAAAHFIVRNVSKEDAGSTEKHVINASLCLHEEAAATSSSAHFGVGDVAQLHAHHPETKGGVLVGHQL